MNTFPITDEWLDCQLRTKRECVEEPVTFDRFRPARLFAVVLPNGSVAFAGQYRSPLQLWDDAQPDLDAMWAGHRAAVRHDRCRERWDQATARLDVRSLLTDLQLAANDVINAFDLDCSLLSASFGPNGEDRQPPSTTTDHRRSTTDHRR